MCGISVGMLNLSPLLVQNSDVIENPKSNAGEITIITPENKTYTESDSGYYPGTYGFENDENDALPEEWEDLSDTYTNLKVISGLAKFL